MQKHIYNLYIFSFGPTGQWYVADSGLYGPEIAVEGTREELLKYQALVAARIGISPLFTLASEQRSVEYDNLWNVPDLIDDMRFDYPVDDTADDCENSFKNEKPDVCPDRYTKASFWAPPRSWFY